MTTVDAREVAGRLTKAQRGWFQSCTDLGLGRVAGFALPDGTVRFYSAGLDALTPLGLAVRAILQERSK